MANFQTYEEYKAEIKSLYKELLEEASQNTFLTKTLENSQEALHSLSISEEKKAEFIISLYAQNTELTLSRTFEQALAILEKCLKMPKELEELDNKVDLIEAQKDEVMVQTEDKRKKSPIEIEILKKQKDLIDKQIEKLQKDIDYTRSQKEKMEEQVQDNRIIKAMDSMGDMISTLGNGGLVLPESAMQVYFKLNKILTKIDIPSSVRLAKLKTGETTTEGRN